MIKHFALVNLMATHRDTLISLVDHCYHHDPTALRMFSDFCKEHELTLALSRTLWDMSVRQWVKLSGVQLSPHVLRLQRQYEWL